MEKILRFELLDVLRGISVVAMIVYHFFWDLGHFGFIELDRVTGGLPLFFAQCIGASFIIISGISAFLHFSLISWNTFKRLLSLYGIPFHC